MMTTEMRFRKAVLMDTAYAGSQYEEDLSEGAYEETAHGQWKWHYLREWTGVYGRERTETDQDHLSVLADYRI